MNLQIYGPSSCWLPSWSLKKAKEMEPKSRKNLASGCHFKTCLQMLWSLISQRLFKLCMSVNSLPLLVVVVVQMPSYVQLYVTPWTAACQASSVHQQLPEFTQTHIHWFDDAIQPSHPLSSPSRPTFNLSQHQGLFKWVSSSHQVAKALQFQLQDQSFQWTPRTDLL